MNISDLFWIFIIFITLVPMFKQRSITHNRLQYLRSIERKRGTRVISLIHRQEAVSLLGIPISRYIDVEDSEQILRAIRLTPDEMPIDLILHTPGGLVLASEQIARAMIEHPAKVTVFVPHYAMSGGTMIALAADEIVMDANAVLGPVDPQLGKYPAASIVEVVKKKDINQIEDETLILADMAEKALHQVENFVQELLEDKMPAEQARAVAKILSEGRWTHDYPITYEKLREMGLKVRDDLHREVYVLMELYPQPAQRRPSVQYIPLPYDDEVKK
ncbi:MAG TPA: ATP-dependent Clp protease proteolytic subunit [Methylomusa anaerophila]|uniref:Serine dehydrogenase proteinase n=1 Tax=Methylomusa anaerophila TaxID=1930071 RepID=A0A348AIH5_9FIRM|nr:ATP-dependent Clp protease proteolytic subunit [Methylomusa anaerophila]BBB90873.1 serine dehydrogenase proteinase [Methylomusa anaerophila]HML90745.1 ATP-dependent Clp protease proteolytic subunit [Methylomusa anaerophila]